MYFSQFDWSVFINSALPAYITAFATVGLIWAAVWQVSSARKEASQRAAYEYYDREFSSDSALIFREKVNSIINSNGWPKHVLEDDPQYVFTPNDERVLLTLLNKYELLAINVRNKAMDEKALKSLWRSTYLADWRALKPYIELLRDRTQNVTLYIEFEKMITSWDNTEI